jgi:hypothetical protein
MKFNEQCEVFVKTKLLGQTMPVKEEERAAINAENPVPSVCIMKYLCTICQ